MNPRIRDIRVILTAPEKINLVVVRVDTTEDGLYGLGCATFSYRHLAVKLVIEEYLRPLLIGRDATAITELWQLMHQNAYWRDGPIANNAISGIDMALWDIKGKMAGMPLYQLFGGKLRSGIQVYRHAEGATQAALFDDIERVRAMGIRHIRCQCGGYGGTNYASAPNTAPAGSAEGIYIDSGKYMRETVKIFEAIRAKFGDEIELIHDVHERLHPTEAVVFTRAMEPLRMFFLEDVVPTEQIEWLRRIREQCVTPLSQGELFNNPVQWKSLVKERLIDYMRVHLSQIGGITPARNLQSLCDTYGVRLCWHGPGDMSPLAHAANIHIDLASPNFGLQEWSGIEPPNFIIQEISEQSALLDVFSGLPEYRDGYVYPNEKAGLGIEIDEKLAAAYPCENTVTTWTQRRLRDGSLQVP